MVLRKVGAAVICLVLFITLIGANTAVALDRGALDAEHMKDAAEEADLYAVIEDEATAQIQEEVPPAEELPVEIDVEVVADEAITEEYITNQGEDNIDEVYARLEGDTDTLELQIDTEPVKENLVDALVTEIQAASIEELGLADVADGRLANLTASESSYEAEQDGFREEIKDRIKAETGLDPAEDFNNDRLAALAASESSYESEREQFKENQKQRIQEETDRHLTEPELEAAYQDQKDEIRTALRSTVEDQIVLPEDAPPEIEQAADDLVDLIVDAYTTDLTYSEFSDRYEQVKADFEVGLDALIDQRMEQIRDELRAELQDRLASADLPEPIQAHTDELVNLIVDAYTTDMSYEAFMSELDALKAVIAEDAASQLISEEIPDEITMSEDEMDQSQQDALDTAEQVVGLIQLLALVLPALALVLIGGLYAVVSTTGTFALGAGGVTVLAGAVSAVLSRIIPGQVAEIAAQEAPEGAAEPITAMIWALFDPLWGQSLLLAGLGILGVGVGVAIWAEVGPFAAESAE